MKTIISAVKLLAFLTIITGFAYPLFITGIAQLLFPQKANGSLIIKDFKIKGSELIGQNFAQPDYFWGRPSAVSNNPLPSGASNFNPIGERLKNKVNERIDTIRKYHGNISLNQIPKDLIFASGSGVDPHIMPETAYFQVARIAKARNFNAYQIEKLKDLIKQAIESRDFLILGEERVNVLKLNLAISGI